ncbi:hypothetical protein PNOK_0859800 [Pyrrhoderma noxium]|uniref:Uncharacterized protein n=1 Tax=Pyrrhoderma noxium TaxID=2282107 RepID=A0A286U842_9AGAM|nr:hypothetical protein PNOK_0859800 [Pyrrhoderma noxium]
MDQTGLGWTGWTGLGWDGVWVEYKKMIERADLIISPPHSESRPSNHPSHSKQHSQNLKATRCPSDVGRFGYIVLF